MIIKDIMKSDSGAIVVSIVLGLGLAALFRRACSGQGCIVIQGPNPKEVSEYVYKVQEDCYTYTPYVAPCTHNSKN
jgi:hypothetical protein